MPIPRDNIDAVKKELRPKQEQFVLRIAHGNRKTGRLNGPQKQKYGKCDVGESHADQTVLACKISHQTTSPNPIH